MAQESLYVRWHFHPTMTKRWMTALECDPTLVNLELLHLLWRLFLRLCAHTCENKPMNVGPDENKTCVLA